MAPAAIPLPQALDQSPLTRLHWKIWVLSAMGVFLDGFDLFIMAVALPAIARQFDLDAWELGLIPAAAVLGAAVGAATLGRLIDRLGRTKIFVLDLGCFIAFATLSALAWNPASLIVFRFLLGVGIGADYPISASYASEILPARVRGRMLVGSFSFQALGMLVGAGVGLLILTVYPEVGAWRWMLAAGIGPALLMAVLRLSAPESPRWLASHGQTEQAARVAEQLCGQPVSVPVETATRQPGYGTLFSRVYLRATVLATAPWFLMDIATYGVGIFTPAILAALAFTRAGTFIAKDIASTEGAAVLDLFLVIGFGLNILLVERWGRMRLQMLGFGGMAAGLLLLSLASAPSGGGDGNLVLVFAGFIVFNVLMNMGPNATTFLIPAEIFPTSVRGSGHGLAAASGKLGAAVGIFALPIVRDAWGTTAVLLMVAGVCLLGLLITAALRVETAGRPLEVMPDPPVGSVAVAAV